MTTAGHTLVLPGIDGWSLFNRGIIPGLRAGGVAGEIEFYDWTRGFPHMLGNLTDPQLHAEQANLLSKRIQRIRQRRGNRPLWLIGHSGGAAMSLITLLELSETPIVTGVILLAPAISPAFDIESALRRTTHGIWNFRSWGDFPILGTSSLLIGNLDGRRSVSAGVRGFSTIPSIAVVADAASVGVDAEGITHEPAHVSAPTLTDWNPRLKTPTHKPERSSPPRLHEVPWKPEMARDGHFGGHFGCVNRRFIRRQVAPLLVSR